MAPEQFQERADARTDVWGLGVTLYELLTLRPAFASRGQIESSEPRQPRGIRRQPPARPRSDLPEGPSQGPTAAVRDGPRVRRRPPPLARPRARCRPTDSDVAPGRTLGEAKQGMGRGDRTEPGVAAGSRPRRCGCGIRPPAEAIRPRAEARVVEAADVPASRHWPPTDWLVEGSLGQDPRIFTDSSGRRPAEPGHRQPHRPRRADDQAV